MTREIKARAALFPRYRVAGPSFARDRSGMVVMTDWQLPEQPEEAAAVLHSEVFNTAMGPKRDGVGIYDLVTCVLNGWADLTRFKFRPIPEEWAAALLQDKCQPDFRGGEGGLHYQLKWNAAGLLYLTGVPDIQMEWTAPYGKRVDVGSPSHGIVVECGSTEVWGAVSALRSNAITSFSIITMTAATVPHEIYTFRRDSHSWKYAESYFAGREAEENREARERMEQFLARVSPTEVQA